MSRKYTVIEDELNIKGTGLYCIMPFEYLDENKKALFKIGLTTKSFKDRMESYHTSFPLGVYLVAFLKAPTAKRIKRAGNIRTVQTLKAYYTDIENKMIQLFTKYESQGITTTTRIRKPDANNLGRTEWFYTDYETIEKVFTELRNIYGGVLHIYNLEKINAEAKKRKHANNCLTEEEKAIEAAKPKTRNQTRRKKKGCYIAQIYYPLGETKGFP